MSLAQMMTRWLPARRAMPGPVAGDWIETFGVRSAADVQVTPQEALTLSTVQACVNLIARSLASVPLVLYRRDGSGRQVAADHPLYPLLHDLANPVQTAYDVRSTLFANVLIYGNAYAEIEWSEDGYPLALWPLAPEQVQLYVTANRSLVYRVTGDTFGIDTNVRWLPPSRVHHLRGLVTQGLLGISPLRAANAIGLAVATERFGARYFGSGAQPSIVLQHPGKLTPEAMRNLRASFEAQWSGSTNAHRIGVVGEGVKAEMMRIAPNEAQFLETRAFQVAEICRIFGVSPGLVGASETATYASAEQDLIRFRELTLGPWAEAHEKAILRDLLIGPEQRDMFARYMLSKLQATDLKTRYDTYMTAKQAGLLTTNEIREMEDYNPVAGGEELWMPLNMAPASVVAAQAGEVNNGTVAADLPARAAAPAALADGTADALTTAWLADVEQRVRARVANDVRQAGVKALRRNGGDGLAAWADEMTPAWQAAGQEMLRRMTTITRVDAEQVTTWVQDEYRRRAAEVSNDN